MPAVLQDTCGQPTATALLCFLWAGWQGRWLIACLLLHVWCCNYLQVAKKTDIFEGSIIRVARRLDELMQQLARAARVIGDEKLAGRFEESNETLRRGIMFSASLYL